MPTEGTLRLDTGLLSVSFDRTAHMDAAVTDTGAVAGLEIALQDEARVYIGSQADRRGPLNLSVSTDRAGLERLAYLLCDKLDLPAFNQGEWLFIADALIVAAELTSEGGSEHFISECKRRAWEIRKAYGIEPGPDDHEDRIAHRRAGT